MKTLYTMMIGDYLPSLSKTFLDGLRKYAERIDGKLHIINERKFPEFPITYEKLQIFELGKNNAWNIFIDLDTIIHEQMYDPTQNYNPSVVQFNSAYDANTQLKPDQYFIRDGRNIGIATNFVVSSNLTHDLWEPLDMTYEEASRNVTRQHILDEYCVSRNFAKYGLKYAGVAPTPKEQELIFHTGTHGKTEEQIQREIEEYYASTRHRT